MPASKYKHVTKRDRTDKPWQAQVKGEYLGCFMKEVQAAEVVAKKLGQPKASFLRPAAASKASKAPKRTHRYVYWHSARHAWQVKIGTEFFGLYPNHEDALAAAVMQTGLQKDDLLLSPDHVCRSLQGQRNSVQMHIAWFQHLYMAYSKPEGVAYQVIWTTWAREHRKGPAFCNILISSFQCCWPNSGRTVMPCMMHS